MLMLKVRTIKLEEGVNLPPYEPYLGPDVAVEGQISRRDSVFQSSSMYRIHGPRSECAANLTSAAGKRVIMELRKPDMGILPLINHLEQWLSRTLKHICIIKEILPTAKDLEEIMEDHCNHKEEFVDLVEATEDVLDQLEALEEVGLRADIAVDLKLKVELEAKLEDIRARIAASGPTTQDLTSQSLRAQLASKKMASTRRALDMDMDDLADLISTILEFFAGLTIMSGKL
ncbi:hypothetical protein L3X38_024302 [Prunus dulcis]|uniref:Uncharacterized protein n=1 Tax=Prunus dulcis TaxID=3755 RepID=A0AAD4VZJ4_PRUDU|nr:hypothetical protein L3X38_024302 [Prunus dulcis]